MAEGDDRRWALLENRGEHMPFVGTPCIASFAVEKVQERTASLVHDVLLQINKWQPCEPGKQGTCQWDARARKTDESDGLGGHQRGGVAVVWVVHGDPWDTSVYR